MIRINENDTDMGAIKEIYSPTGKLVSKLQDKIGGKCKIENKLTQTLLADWFLVDGADIGKGISDYLFRRDTDAIIDAFAKKACEAFWGDGSLSKALLRYHANAKKSQGRALRSAQLKLFRSALEVKHISAEMFDVVNGETRLRPLSSDDLTSEKEIRVTLREPANSKLEEFLDACRRIFNYTEFSKEYRDKILIAIGVSVCPYCNRQYISAWGTGHSTADIEHFYDKDRYPFLALSFYNFIPSCQICNSRFKLTKDFFLKPHLNPYKNGFEQDARFQIKNMEALLDNDILPELELHSLTNREEIANSAETFHLVELYQNHRDYAKEIINKARMFSATQLAEYLNEYEGLFSSKSELYRTIYGNYLKEEDQGKRPLSKLTQDLLYDLSVPTDYE